MTHLTISDTAQSHALTITPASETHTTGPDVPAFSTQQSAIVIIERRVVVIETYARVPDGRLMTVPPAGQGRSAQHALTEVSTRQSRRVWPRLRMPIVLALVALVAGAGWAIVPSSSGARPIEQQAPPAPAAAETKSGSPAAGAPLGVLTGSPSIDAAQIDAILANYGSPATGSGAAWVALGQHYGIDPAYAVAFFIHESGAGTNPAWAGIKPDGSTTHNIGNIICAGYPTCYGRFRDYPSWDAGIEDWYTLIAVEYVQGRGLTTIAEILPIYAPASENDTAGYIRSVEDLVRSWREQAVSTAATGESVSLTLAGNLGVNVLAALNASNGALRDVTIAAGQTWSLNATVGNPAGLDLRVVGGVLGGGWCDLAARYVQAVRPLLPNESIQFIHHGIALADVSWEDAVSIWNIDGQPGSHNGAQDLEITNTLSRPIRLQALITPDGAAVVVQARVAS